jgi:hypothetical protein
VLDPSYVTKSGDEDQVDFNLETNEKGEYKHENVDEKEIGGLLMKDKDYM